MPASIRPSVDLPDPVGPSSRNRPESSKADSEDETHTTKLKFLDVTP